MHSEKEVLEVADINKTLLALGQAAFIEQLPASEYEDIRKKVIEHNTELFQIAPKWIGDKEAMRTLMFREWRRSMNDRERLIYEAGVSGGRKLAIDWVIGDIDDLFMNSYNNNWNNW